MQYAAEAFVSNWFGALTVLGHHAKRVTVTKSDSSTLAALAQVFAEEPTMTHVLPGTNWIALERARAANRRASTKGAKAPSDKSKAKEMAEAAERSALAKRALVIFTRRKIFSRLNYTLYLYTR